MDHLFFCFLYQSSKKCKDGCDDSDQRQGISTILTRSTYNHQVSVSTEKVKRMIWGQYVIVRKRIFSDLIGKAACHSQRE
jgi:hypothetical protein